MNLVCGSAAGIACDRVAGIIPGFQEKFLCGKINRRVPDPRNFLYARLNF
jgi:hypothetical protein